jgi:hypothetical protein
MDFAKTPEDRSKWEASGDHGTRLLEAYKKYTEE